MKFTGVNNSLSYFDCASYHKFAVEFAEEMFVFYCRHGSMSVTTTTATMVSGGGDGGGGSGIIFANLITIVIIINDMKDLKISCKINSTGNLGFVTWLSNTRMLTRPRHWIM